MRKFGLFAGGTVLATLALAGCGAKQAANQGGDSGETLKILAASVGEKSAAKQSAHLTMTIDALGMSFKGQGDVRYGESPAIDMTMTSPQIGEMTMRFVDDVFYIKAPNEADPGKPWIKIDTKGTDPIAKALGPAVEEMKRNSDPGQTLKQLEEVGEITAKKQEQLGGVETTRYTVTVDVKKMLEKEQDSEFKTLLEQSLGAGTTTLVNDVWLNAENLPVRLVIEMPFPDPIEQKPATLKTTVDFSDWGKAITVEAPPADQIGETPR